MCRAFRPSAMLPRKRLRFIQKGTAFSSLVNRRERGTHTSMRQKHVP